MAKSLRSKWKRKMRAVKRERYGEKEHARLINMLTAAGEYPQIEGEVKVEVEEIPTTTTVIPARRGGRVRRQKIRGEGRKSRKDQSAEDMEEIVDEDMESENDDEEEQEDGMAVDKPNHIFSKRTMRDQFGNYPAWMNKRKMRTQQKKNKRIVKRRALSLAGKRIKKLT